MANDSEVSITLIRTSVVCTRRTGMLTALAGGGRVGGACSRKMVRIVLSDAAKTELRGKGQALPDEKLAYGMCASCFSANAGVLGCLEQLIVP